MKILNCTSALLPFLCLLAILLAPLSHGFVLFRSTHFNTMAITSTRLNEKTVTVTNMDNGMSIEIAPGSPLSLAANRSGMRLSFQCKQGTCKSCTTVLDGKNVDTCMTKVPDKAKIQLQKKKRIG
jgi:ferredoxin